MGLQQVFAADQMESRDCYWNDSSKRPALCLATLHAVAHLNRLKLGLDAKGDAAT